MTFRPVGDRKTGIAVDLMDVRQEGSTMVAYGTTPDGHERVRFLARYGPSHRRVFVDPRDFLESEPLDKAALLLDVFGDG